MDESLIMEIWDTFREYIPEKNREIAANQYVEYLLGKDVDISILESLQGYDQHLDNAITLVIDQDAELDDGDDYLDDEDQDYS